MSVYRNEKHGFEIDIPDEWSFCRNAPPLLPSLTFMISNGWLPRADVEFTTGPNEYLNIVVEKMNPEPSPDFLETFLDQYSQQMGFSNCMFGRILVGGKEHVWARYRMRDDVWSKKYMIILNGIGYAITASCAGMEMAIRRQETWDEIAKSLLIWRPDK